MRTDWRACIHAAQVDLQAALKGSQPTRCHHLQDAVDNILRAVEAMAKEEGKEERKAS